MLIAYIQLYRRREKVIRSDEERNLWEQIDPLYMTEESSDEESESMKLHHLEWQSDGNVCVVKLLYYTMILAELEELKQVLDNRIKEKEVCAGHFSAKPRIEGVPSSLPIPRNAVQWAVKR